MSERRAPAPSAHVLDRLIGAELPRFATPADVAAFEAQAPWDQRVAAQSTYQALQLGAAINPDAPALHFLPDADPDAPPLTWTHAEFFGQVTQAANLFHRLGVGAGDVVSLLLPLLPQAFVALYGAQAVGVANPVNPMLSAAQLAEILHAAGTQVLVTTGPTEGSDLWEKVQTIRGLLPELRTVLVVGGAPETGPDEAELDDFDDLLARQPATHLVSGRLPLATDIAGYFHTGGTTGTPKLVRHQHRNQVYQAWGLRIMGLAEPGRAVLFGLPLFHVGGALTQGLAILANGGRIVVLSAAGWRNPHAVRNVWRLVQRYRPTLFGGVPTVIGAALQVPVGAVDINSLRRVSAGGSAIPVAVILGYEDGLQLPVLEVYGMTETASVHTMVYPDMPRQAGSVGRPLPYSRTRVVRIDAEGRFAGDCAPDEIGVVAMAGPGCFDGYRSAQHNRGAFVEPGWVNSGDLGRLDADGLLWITGRAKDLIIRGGHNIDPAPLEEVLYRHPAVSLAALVGQPDAYAGELPVAYVQAKPGQTVTPAELIAWLREHTPERAAVPVALHLIETMPLTAVGKIFKPALRLDAMRRVAEQLLQTALAGQGADASAWTVAVLPDATHGQVIRVTLTAPAGPQRQALEAAVHQALGPLALHHEVG
ncbi:MAG: acyl-CoA synthetase [Burkholderiales bacterium RIFCSPHIGHO2_12_FULL_69_20]|nr:MAG: acyl-CoA synthetase [Burkholderiales bacterium RIFCSPHIGHO2_12_FULL_69_20]